MPGTCFVVMGFGEKTDFATGRVLNLDKTYRNVIKPAVLDAGLDCIRADEIVHSGVIDVPMYEQLLAADVVVADLSTSNANAFYELGVRHALRPYSTIAIAESKMKYPFDVNHTVIRTYEHLGSDIGYDEVVRLRAELTTAIKTMLTNQKSDSPVYTYLNGLTPPTLAAIKRASQAIRASAALLAADPDAAPSASVRMLLDQAQDALDEKPRGNYDVAKALYAAAHALHPNDAHIKQRLALATYKSETPTRGEALLAARAILETMDPAHSTDPETLGLWGAVHRRLGVDGDAAAFDVAISAYEKGFFLKNDCYNGINFALLSNERALRLKGNEAIADFVAAQRIRKRVIALTLEEIKLPHLSDEDRYWSFATLAEAHFGIGDQDGYELWMAKAREMKPSPRMLESTEAQIARLRELLATPLT